MRQTLDSKVTSLCLQHCVKWNFWSQKNTFFALASLGVVKSPWKCEKWILYKILHRLSSPKIFPTKNFSTKKIILKIKNRNFWKKLIFERTNFFYRTFFEIEKLSIFFVLSKIDFFQKFRFSIFKIIFFVENFWV